MKHSLSLSPKALTLSTGHTRILKAHAIYKVWDYQRWGVERMWRAVCVGVCLFLNDHYQEVYLPQFHRGAVQS